MIDIVTGRNYFNALVAGDADGAARGILQMYAALPQSTSTGVDTHFLVDVSGSMGHRLASGATQLQAAVDGMKYIIQDVLDANRGDRVSLTTFSTGSHDVLVNESVPHNKNILLHTVDSLQIHGGTQLFSAFCRKLKAILQNLHNGGGGGNQQFLFVFTDGAVRALLCPINN